MCDANGSTQTLGRDITRRAFLSVGDVWHRCCIHKAVQNHGHAGAVAGIRIAEAAARAAAHAAAKTKAQTASQAAAASIRSRSTQAPLRRYFGTHSHAGVGLSSGSREPCRIAAFEAQSTRSRAPEGIGGTAGSSAQPTVQQMCQILASHDHSLRELEAWSTLTWLLDQNSELAKHLLAHMDAWKQKSQQGQPHPDGPARLTVGAALATWVLDSPERRAACPQFAVAHDKIASIAFSSLS